MKVLQIIDHLGSGGAQQVLFSLVTNLPKSDFETRIISLRGDSALVSRLRSLGYRVETLNMPKYGLLPMRKLRSAIKQAGPDIVHTHLDFSNTFAARAARAEGAPVIIRHDHSGSGSQNRRYFTKRLMLEKLAGSSSHVVAVSKGVRAFNLSLGIDPGRITVIFNGVDLNRFAPGQSGNGPEERPASIVGFVGRLCWYKGLDNLVAAAPAIIRRVPSARFVIIGEGPEGDRLRRKVAAAGLDKVFSFLGHQDEPERFYGDFDVVVMPSVIEAFPVGALEAMAMSRPVVASRVGGLTEIIENDVNGFLVDPGDSGLLADRVCRLLQDKKLAKQIGARARKRVESHYSLEVSTREIIDLYLRLSSNPKARGRGDKRLRVV